MVFHATETEIKQESPAIADKPARCFRKRQHYLLRTMMLHLNPIGVIPSEFL